MDEQHKPWYASKTVWFNLAAIVALALQIDVSQLNQFVNELFALIASAAGIWGRIVAKKKIK